MKEFFLLIIIFLLNGILYVQMQTKKCICYNKQEKNIIENDTIK